MHIRVLLSRYRAYTPCAACEGARLKPDALLWRLGTKEDADRALGSYARFKPHAMRVDAATLAALPGLTMHDLMLLPVGALPGVLREPAPSGAARPGDRPAADRDPRPARLSHRGGLELPHARPAVAHAVRRRGAADQPHHRARHLARQHAVRARRAVDRAPPARHGSRDRRHEAAARRRQLAGRRRARPADHVRRRPHPRPGPGPGGARRGDRLLRPAPGAEAGRDAHRTVPLGAPQGRRRVLPPDAASQSADASDPRRRRAQPQGHRRRISAEPPDLRDRRLGLGKVDPRAGRALRRAPEGEGQADRSAGRAPGAPRRPARRRRRARRPVADRQDHALQPGELRRRVRRDPQAVCRDAGRAGARLHRRHVQLQRRQRPLPDLQRQRLRARRDAVPLGRVPPLPRLRRQALPTRGARCEVERAAASPRCSK